MRTQAISFIAGLFAICLGSSSAFAGDPHQNPSCPDCTDPTREVCFNLMCHYEFKNEYGSPKNCTVSSTFTKNVTVDGGEVQDDSSVGNNPRLDISCDNEKIFNNSAHRFTDLLGTRIQGQTGPSPAVLLPRGALHSGQEGQSGSHYSKSILELDNGREFVRANGKCFIWTGTP